MILTFDDGPDAIDTPQVLEALANECVRATFFEIGRNAEALPQLRGARCSRATRSRTTLTPILSRRCASCPRRRARADILKGMIAVEKAAYGAGISAGAPTDLPG